MAEHQKLDREDSYEEEQARRVQQSIDTLNQAADKIEDFLENNEPRIGHGKRQQEVKSNITDNESAKMTTSKGTIQGCNGVATVDKQHQIVIDARVFGEGSEHHTLQPVLETIKERYKRPSRANPDASHVIPASEFNFDPITLSCQCPAGKTLHADGTKKDKQGNLKAYFRGRLKHCQDCDIKHKCMRNPKSAEHSNGYGRQVSFLIDKTKDATYTDWMKVRVDSKKGKQIYSHRMSVVEPVFGNITSNKKLKRFSLRRKIKVNAQWMMFCLIQNIEKLANYGQLPA